MSGPTREEAHGALQALVDGNARRRNLIAVVADAVQAASFEQQAGDQVLISITLPLDVHADLLSWPVAPPNPTGT